MTFEEQIFELRKTIDDIDEQIIELLTSRFRHCLEVGALKKKFDVSVMQPSRVREVIERAAAAGHLRGMSPEFVRQVWELIIAEACRMESAVMEGKLGGSAP